MATMVDLEKAARALGLPVETAPGWLTNGHDGVLLLDRPRLGYLHHTVATLLASVYYSAAGVPGWPADEWRPAVPAPRANVYVARARSGGCRTGCPHKGRAHLVFTTAGKAHHAGEANLGRIKLARAGGISVATPDATGLPDDYLSAGFESVGVEVDWTTGEGWPADLLDLIARLMRLAVHVFGWPGVGCWINHRQATYRKVDMNYRGDIWARAAAISPEPEDDMPTVDEIKTAMREVLNEGTAAGQTSWATTSRATLGAVQGVVNLVNSTAGGLATRITESRSAVLAAIAALPTAGLSEAERTELAEAIAGLLEQAGVSVDTEAVAEALAVDLAARLAA